MQECKRCQEEMEAPRLQIQENRATTEHIESENRFIMLDLKQMDVMAREFWDKAQIVLRRSRNLEETMHTLEEGMMHTSEQGTLHVSEEETVNSPGKKGMVHTPATCDLYMLSLWSNIIKPQVIFLPNPNIQNPHIPPFSLRHPSHFLKLVSTSYEAQLMHMVAHG